MNLQLERSYLYASSSSMHQRLLTSKVVFFDHCSIYIFCRTLLELPLNNLILINIITFPTYHSSKHPNQLSKFKSIAINVPRWRCSSTLNKSLVNPVTAPQVPEIADIRDTNPSPSASVESRMIHR